MIEAPHLHPEAIPVDAAELAELEKRIHRMEDAIAALQDTRLLEERVAGRVSDQVSRAPAPASADSAPFMGDPARQLPPPALESSLAEAHSFTPPSSFQLAGSGWLLFELYQEIRTIFRMLLDRRYRFSWTGRLLPVAILF